MKWYRLGGWCAGSLLLPACWADFSSLTGTGATSSDAASDAAVALDGWSGQDAGPEAAPNDPPTPHASRRGDGGGEDGGGADASSSVVLRDDFSTYTVGEVWDEGSSHGPWRVVWSGGGRVRVVGTATGNALSLRPAAPTAGDSQTALVVSSMSVQNMSFQVRMTTATQLRADPNPWEVSWLVWCHTDNTHFYYVILKPNGWELGKEDPAYPGNQRFLATGDSPTFPVGDTHEVTVEQVDARTTVVVDGSTLVSFTDTERPYIAGAIGLYVEDADGRFTDVTVTAK